MRKWLKNKYYFCILALLILVALVYRDSFTSRFFQDDKLLLGLSNSANIFAPIANFPYRPIAIGMFYSLGRLLFGTNVLGFHLLEFIFFGVTLFALFVLANKILRDAQKSLATVFFYALNISLFANFYWVATSYFSLGFVLFLLAIISYLGKGKWSIVGLYLFAVLAIGSNELAFVLPGIFILLNWFFKNWPKKFWIFTGFDLILIILRTLIAGLPKGSDYAIKINLSVFSNLRWYGLRALNLPEGVNRAADSIIWVSFFVFILVLIYAFWKYWRLGHHNSKVLVFGAGWFIISALPFFFLPGHMSSYYLTFSLLGPAIVLAEIFGKSKLLYLAGIAYLILTVTGLHFLSQTHWIILKNTGPIGSF